MTHIERMKGNKIILLKPLDQSQEIAQQLNGIGGADVVNCPMIEINPVLSNLHRISRLFLEPFKTIIFTSANGVRYFMGALFEKGMDARTLADKKIIAVGPKTKESLLPFGIVADAMPEKFASEKILGLLSQNLHDEHILIPTAWEARQELPDELQKRGAHVVQLKIYKNSVPQKINAIPICDGNFVSFHKSFHSRKFFYQPTLTPRKESLPFVLAKLQKIVFPNICRKMFILLKRQQRALS